MAAREIGAEEQERLVRQVCFDVRLPRLPRTCLANICWCQVHRAIALEEKGRFAQAAEKFEAALRTYSDAGRSRPKLRQRLEECRRKLEPDGGIISSSLLDERNEGDPFARARSRRAIARAQEGALAATAIQSAFRGKRDRNQLAATRSK